MFRAAHATKAYSPEQNLRVALENLGSTRDRASRGAFLNLVYALRGVILRNPDRERPSIPAYERYRASKGRTGRSAGRIPRKNRFDDKDPDADNNNNNNNSNNSSSSNDSVKNNPTSRSTRAGALPGPRNASGGTPVAPPFRPKRSLR